MKTPYTVESPIIDKIVDAVCSRMTEGSMLATPELQTDLVAILNEEGAHPAPREAKEGPSVEDIKKTVEEVLDEHGLEIDGNANVELHRDLVARLSALFTQTQVEPEIIRAGNAMRDTIASICRQLIHGSVTIERADMDKLLGEWGAWDRAGAAQGIGGAAESRSDEGGRERSGPPQSPVAEERSDAPKNNEEQSEDAALPDGRYTEEDLAALIAAGDAMRKAIIADNPLIDTGTKLGMDLYESIHNWTRAKKESPTPPTIL